MKYPVLNWLHFTRSIFLLPAICFLTLGATLGDAPASSTLQFRLVLDNPTTDSEPMTVVEPGQFHRPPEVLNIQKTVLLDQSAVKKAIVVRDGRGNPTIDVEFTDNGARQLAALTRDLIGKRLAIVVDGKLFSAPKINSEISGGKAVIAGTFTEQQAQSIAARLNGSTTGEMRTGGGSFFYVVAALFFVGLAVLAWFLTRKGRAMAGG
jgi:hypothetical protein